ncbi:MAG: NAD-dependent epimerase/dehydratase family protein, partial [Candidatus Thorarchaeota archaeon]
MCRILITGGKGFIANSLSKLLSYDNISLGKEELNLLNREEIIAALHTYKPDIIVHSATYDAAPQFSTNSKEKVLEFNLRMFYNLASLDYLYDRLIYFGSGSEYGRDFWYPKMKEDDIGKNIPSDSYGFSKYIMNAHAINNLKIINLRLFTVYGEFDDWRYRLVSNLCVK